MKKGLLFFLFSLLSHASISQTEWEWLNPKPIGNPLTDVEFVSENTGFILSANMVFKTTNLGETWQNHYVVSNAVDFDFNQNTGLIAANSSIIYLSTNKGETWESRNINFAVTSLHTANVISDKELAVAGVNNIFTSNDGGKNWNKLPIPTSNITKTHFFSTEVGLVFTSNGQIYKTTNAGLKWTLTNSVSFTPSNYVQVHFVNEKVGYLSRQHGAILKTTDGGDTWVVLHPTSDLIYSFSFLDENTGFLVGADGVIYSTVDGAKTLDWKGFQVGRIYNTSMFGTYFINKNIGFAVGARGMIQKTIDGGKTWKQYSLTYDDIRKVRFPSQDTGYFLTNNKLYKSLDNGTNWSEKYNFKEAIYNSHFFSKDKIIVTGINKIYKSLDGGTTWKTIVPNNNLFSYVTITALSFVDDNTGYISGNYNGLDQFVSTTKDGGETWTLISKNDFSVYDFHFFDTKNAIGLRGGDLYQTTDGGLNWKKTYEIYGNLTQINVVADSIVYISGEFNTVLKSTNKGRTWRELQTTYDHLKSIYFINPNTGFASGEYGKFFQTSNGGNTWKDYYLGSTFYSLYANSTNVFGSGDYGVIRKSKFTVDEFGASANLAENISSSEATLTGWLFTNTTEITNVKFEYGINSANLTKISSTTPTIVSLSNDAPRILVKNLLPKTNYIYFISYDYKGKHYETNRVLFKTLSEVDITEFYTYNLGSKQTSLVSKVTSRNKSVTELTFEYGKNKTLSEKVIPRPDSVKAKTQANIEAEITGLTPDTDYIARLKTKSNGQVYYSDTLKFRTLSRYTLQIQEPRLNNPSFQLQGTVYAPDDSVKNMFFEYDTTKFFTNPKIATISPNFTISRRNYYFNSQLPSLDSTKIYYARFRAKVEKEDITGPIQFFTLQKKIIIMPLESTFLPPNQVTLNSMIYSSGKNLYNIKFFYGENGQLTDSVWASPNSIYGYGTFRPQAILKSLKPNTIYTGRIKGTADNKTVLSDKFTFYNGVVTSVEEDKNLDITIFPNPSSGIINITSNEKIIKYEVLKIDGILLKEILPDTEKINISDLQSGIYILRVYLKMQAKSFKIIKF